MDAAKEAKADAEKKARELLPWYTRMWLVCTCRWLLWFNLKRHKRARNGENDCAFALQDDADFDEDFSHERGQERMEAKNTLLKVLREIFVPENEQQPIVSLRERERWARSFLRPNEQRNRYFEARERRGGRAREKRREVLSIIIDE